VRRLSQLARRQEEIRELGRKVLTPLFPELIFGRRPFPSKRLLNRFLGIYQEAMAQSIKRMSLESWVKKI